MRLSRLFIPLFLLLAFPLAGLPVRAQALPETPGAITICAGNIPPEGMVITATGTSPECGGSCRARQAVPVSGSIMVICAQQPIPENYEIQSITSAPLCKCLAEDDNAYVIRLRAGVPTPSPAAAPHVAFPAPTAPPGP